MDTGLFLLGQTDSFRAKIDTFFPADYHQKILETAERGGQPGSITSPLYPPFNWHAALAWVLTGRERHALDARRSILHFTAQLRERELYREGQIDHWVGALPVARVLIYYTWVRSSGVFSRADRIYVEQSFADYMYLNVYQSTRLKALHDGNNQTAALVVSCLIMGYILGHLIDTRASAQMVLRYGFERIGPLVGSMPQTGYTGEGSTYMAVVAAPTFALLDAILQYMTGAGLAGKRFMPEGSCVDDLFEMNYRCFTPSGYLLPWDHYDYVPALGAAALSWYAHYDRPELLGLIREFNLFDYNHEIMWGGDDQVLAAVFWPELNEKPHEFRHWFHPRVGAALSAGSDTGLYCFQMWDRCAGANPVRQQANPNSVVFEFGGVPFLMDGMPTEECRRFADADTEFRNPDGLAYNFGYGTLAGHNVIIVDDQEFYRPEQTAEGRGTAGLVGGVYPAVRADVTEFYRDIPDVLKVERTSILLSSYSVAIVDDLHFAAEHRYEARFFLRGKASRETLKGGAEAYRAEIDGVCAYLISDSGCETEHEYIEGYPRVFEGLSTRVGIKGRGKECRLIHVMCGQHSGTRDRPAIERTFEHLRVFDEAGVHTLDLKNVPPAGALLQPTDCITAVGTPETETYPYYNLSCPGLREPRPPKTYESAHDVLFAHAAPNSAELPDLIRELMGSVSWEDQLAAVDCVTHTKTLSDVGRLLQILRDQKDCRYNDIYERYVWLREGKPGESHNRCEWRLKTALIRAVGELEIHDARVLIEQILAGPDHTAVHKACRESLKKLAAGA